MLTVSYTYADGRAFTLSLADAASAKDQTAAIQKALSAVGANGGGNVSLSAGDWTVQGTGKASDGCLKISSNTLLEGAGSATVLKLADGSTAVTGMLRTASGKLNADGTYTIVDNVTVKNLVLDGNAAHTSGDVDGFYCGPKPGTAQADTNIALDGVESRNCSRYGFDPHERTVGLTFKNCIAHHNGVDGFTIDFCSNVVFENNAAYANGRHGFNLVTGTSNVTMTGNNAYDNGGSGISLQTGNNEIRAWTDSITISGGTLANNGRNGIEGKQTSNVSIAGVTITGSADDAIRFSGVEHATITGNVYVGNGGGWLPVRIEGYLQDFSDTDVANDRWIATTNVRIDGVLQGNPPNTSGAAAWAYLVTDAGDVISGSSGVDTIAAGSGDDTVTGNAGNDHLLGNDGRDTLDGGAGSDRLYGGAGADRLLFSTGYDLLDGGAGLDTAVFSKASSAVNVTLTATVAQVTMGGVAVADLVSIENLVGTSQTDMLSGNAVANTLTGGGGADVLDGGAGNDTLIGGGGNDRLTGGIGDDVLTGGTGSDVFAFNLDGGTDTITDFTRKQDKLAITGVADMNGVTITQTGADTDIAIGSAHIVLTGVAASTLTASDFVFM